MTTRQAPTQLSEVELRQGVAALVRELGEEKARAFLGMAASQGGKVQLSRFVAQAILGGVGWAKTNPQAALAGAAVAVGGIGALVFQAVRQRRAEPCEQYRESPYEVDSSGPAFDPDLFKPPSESSSTGIARPPARVDPETGYIDVDGYDVR